MLSETRLETTGADQRLPPQLPRSARARAGGGSRGLGVGRRDEEAATERRPRRRPRAVGRGPRKGQPPAGRKKGVDECEWARAFGVDARDPAAETAERATTALCDATVGRLLRSPDGLQTRTATWVSASASVVVLARIPVTTTTLMATRVPAPALVQMLPLRQLWQWPCRTLCWTCPSRCPAPDPLESAQVRTLECRDQGCQRAFRGNVPAGRGSEVRDRHRDGAWGGSVGVGGTAVRQAVGQGNAERTRTAANGRCARAVSVRKTRPAGPQRRRAGSL